MPWSATSRRASATLCKKEFVATKDHVWTCAKGTTTEGATNAGTTVAIMRITDVLETSSSPQERGHH
jgi:hypothetical protein